MFGLNEIMVIVTHSSLLFFVIINPSIQLLLLAIAYGQNLTDIKIYYTNNDHRKTSLHGVTYNYVTGFEKTWLSCTISNTDFNY